jgi:NAD(P)H-hydrate epimerase
VNAELLAREGWPCPTGAEMREVDRRAIEDWGLDARLLMENAGRAAAHAIRTRYPRARRPLVVCGAGNNGGDGFVVARVLGDWDGRVRPRVLALGPSGRRSPEARANLDLLLRSGCEVLLEPDGKEIAELGAGCDLAVDALFGVGLARPIDGALVDAFARLRARGVPVVSIDVPSGLAADGGEGAGGFVPADLVLTLGLPKLALATRALEAEIVVADIGLPWAIVEQARIGQQLWTSGAARARLPARPAGGHKGTFGHVLVVGGSEGKTGAACLASEAALRAGAGLVTAAAPRSLHAIYEEKLTECMTFPVDEGAAGCFGLASVPRLAAEAGARDVVVLGPGLGREAETARAVERLLAELERPTVVDADGLWPFAGRPEALRSAAARVLTPHPGELSRLLERPARELERDRVAAARELARRSGAVAVLKGARTVVARPDGAVRINPTGGPGLASGGTGDVLAGAIGALLAQRLEPFDAAALGVYLHGLAGEIAGSAGALAGDVARLLPEARRRVESTREPDEGDLLRRFL